MSLVIRPYTHQSLGAVIAFWEGRRAAPMLLQPSMTAVLVASRVISNTLFDLNGLILAVEESGSGPKHVVGLVHAAFPPDPEYMCPTMHIPQLNAAPFVRREGIIIMVAVEETLPPEQQQVILGQLLAAAENYFREKHVQTIYGGGVSPYNPPFYNELCGVGDACGVLEADQPAHEAFQTAGYQKVTKTVVHRLPLTTWTPPVNPEILSAKRTHTAISHEWKAETSWESMTMLPGGNPHEFQTYSSDGHLQGRLVLREIPAELPDGTMTELFVTHRFVCKGVSGISSLERQEIGLVLWDCALASLKQLAPTGVVEWILRDDPTFRSRIHIAESFGFTPFTRGVIYRREL
ncbi:MAG: hypothetical protein PHE53_09665 [Thermoguttaceae bacterium]|nr:hypothetical protein [Thermoguttaceae bacterium]